MKNAHPYLLIPTLAWIASSFLTSNAQAAMNVLTTTTDLRSLVQEVGGDLVTVDSVAKGTQDPHFIEAKPSFMLKANRADLVIAVGLELEIGWLPSILRGARNPRINPGGPGYLEVGPLIDPLEVVRGNVTRADGDVHQQGNPHITLDPIRTGEVAISIGERLGLLDPPNSAKFAERAKAFQTRMKQKSEAWSARIQKSGVKKIISYHKTLTYFFDRFKIQNTAILEPKPGIPPTSGHILEVVAVIKSQKVPVILVENYFDPAVTRKIIQEVPTVRAHTVPVAVEGDTSIKTLDDLYENLVATIEGSRK